MLVQRLNDMYFSKIIDTLQDSGGKIQDSASVADSRSPISDVTRPGSQLHLKGTIALVNPIYCSMIKTIMFLYF